MAGSSSRRRRRRKPSSPPPAPAHPLEDDDLLHEILLRLPPQPPYLLRASLVSKGWRRLASVATDRKFLRRFRLHHRRPPLLGHFSYEDGRISFRSTLDPPYRIPPNRFSLRVGGRGWKLVDCRHGRVLILNWEEHQLIVWDPITGDRSHVAVPREFGDMTTGAVLCAAGDQGHVHGSCHSTPFKVALLSSYEHDDDAVAFASVFSSETSIWSDILSTPLPYRGICSSFSSTLVGNTLHWLLLGNENAMLEFDLDRQILVLTKRTPDGHENISAQIIRAKDGGVGLAALSWTLFHQLSFQIWERKVSCNDAAVWVLLMSVESRKMLGLGSKIDMARARIVQYAEDLHAIFVCVDSCLLMVPLKTMQSKELFKSDHLPFYYPFTSFYAEGILE